MTLTEKVGDWRNGAYSVKNRPALADAHFFITEFWGELGNLSESAFLHIT